MNGKKALGDDKEIALSQVSVKKYVQRDGLPEVGGSLKDVSLVSLDSSRCGLNWPMEPPPKFERDCAPAGWCMMTMADSCWRSMESRSSVEVRIGFLHACSRTGRRSRMSIRSCLPRAKPT